MTVINERLGEIRLNSFGTKMKIVRYNSSDDVSVEFMDEHHYSTTTNYSNFKNGNVKNPYDKTIFGIGYLGDGKYATKMNGVMLESYRVWYDMMRRCYSIKSKEKFSAYFGICSVAEIWHNYQNFAEWFNNNKYDVKERLHIDKDILFPDNRVYCPEMCVLTPQRINMLFKKKPNMYGLPNDIKPCGNGKYEARYNGKYLGVYETIKEAIESHDKAKKVAVTKVANEYKEAIPVKLYNALLMWKISS